MRYKSVHALKSESDDLWKWLSRELARLDRVTSLTKAIVEDDLTLMKSASSDDVAAARADLVAIKAEYGETILPNGWRLASIMRKYAQRTAEIAEEAKRSRRFNELWEVSKSATGQPTLH